MDKNYKFDVEVFDCYCQSCRKRRNIANGKSVVAFNVNVKIEGTTTIVYGQMICLVDGKISVAGCSILAPKDTYDELTGIKVAFRNMLSGYYEGNSKQKVIYGAFRKLLSERV